MPDSLVPEIPAEKSAESTQRIARTIGGNKEAVIIKAASVNELPGENPHWIGRC